MISSIIDGNPMIKQLADSNPMVRLALTSPTFMKSLMKPEVLKAASEYQSTGKMPERKGEFGEFAK